MTDPTVERTVDDFFAKGATGDMTPEQLAQACDRRVRAETQRSTVDSIRLARAFVNRAKSRGGILYLTALRAQGWALLVAGEYRESEKSYLKARSLVIRQAPERARIDRVLIDVYMYLGNYKEARRRARLALATFKRLRAQADVAKTRVNYANVLHRQDRHREANRLYRQASEFFSSRGDDLATALCDYNLANTHVQLFDFETADSLYTRAREIFRRHGHHLHATGCLYGLAWLHMLEGNFHSALRELSECEEEYRRGRQTRELILCQLDRAESYLGLNLCIDARKAAEQAGKNARRLGITYEAAKAAFFSGKASIGLGRTHDAIASLKEAEQGFRRMNNQGFLAATQLTLAQLYSNGQRRLAKISAARKRFEKAQLPLWEAICDLQMLVNRQDGRGALRRLSRNQAAKAVPHLVARKYTLMGDREARHRRMEKAVSHWTRAADVLDAMRAKLPPVDMRSSFFRHESDPFHKLIDTEADRDAFTAALWSERYKTAGLWSPKESLLEASPVRRRIQQSLSELASRVTALSSFIGDSGERRVAVSTARKGSLARLQRQVRDDLAALEQLNGERQTNMAELATRVAEVSDSYPVVQFHVGQENILAFVHYKGSTHIHRYIDGRAISEEFSARWGFLVERASTVGYRPKRADLEDERQVIEHISSWLVAPLELPADSHQVLILPEGYLSKLPWLAMRTGGAALIDRWEVTFAPSLRHHLYARRQRTGSPRMKLFVGQTKGLRHVRKEFETVLSRFDSGATDVYDPCCRADWPENGRAKIWHFLGHAVFRADNPFYSAVLVADGPTFAADFRLKHNTVSLITLAACRTGQQTSLPGEESIGLVRSLLEMGGRNVVASHWAVSDYSTSHWMDLLYKHYLGGSSVAQAIRYAALGVREKFPSAYHWGAFSVFGAG